MKYFTNLKIVLLKFIKPNQITPAWFYTVVRPPLRWLQIYIRGDALVLIPFIILVLLIGIFSWIRMLIVFFLYLAFRYLGEMIYWLLQQFGDHKYRPPDYGLKHLGNNELYIIYQLTSLVGLVVSTALVIYILSINKQL